MPGDGIAPHKLAGAVHGPVKIRLLLALPPPRRRLSYDDPGIELGIDRHLLARHGIEGEAGGHFGDPPRTLGDDQEVDNDQDGEDDQTHRVVTTDDKGTEGLDYLARRIPSRRDLPAAPHGWKPHSAPGAAA